MSFTHRNLRGDVDDVAGNFDGDPGLEFRLATTALGLEHSGLGYQRVPPGYRFPYGHVHRMQEEVYVVTGGSGRMKIDDEIIVWEDGKVLAFDDACEHEAWNDSDEARYVFFVQTRWPLPGWEGVVHTGIHKVLSLAARSVPAKATELDLALNGWR